MSELESNAGAQEDYRNLTAEEKEKLRQSLITPERSAR